MIIDEENKNCFLQALRVDFLTEPWEKELYTKALMSASVWGKKIEKENKEYFSKNHLIDKYNI
jgi:hypothetical protein